MDAAGWSLRRQRVDAEAPLKGFKSLETALAVLAVEVQDREITFATTEKTDIRIRPALPPLSDHLGIRGSIFAAMGSLKRNLGTRHDCKNMKTTGSVAQTSIEH